MKISLVLITFESFLNWATSLWKSLAYFPRFRRIFVLIRINTVTRRENKIL